MTVVVYRLISLFFLIHLFFFLRILLFLCIGVLFGLVFLLIINDFLLVMGSFDLCSELVSLFDSVDMVKELSHEDILDLILDALMGNVVFFEHELFLLEFEGNLVVSLSFMIV
jgi:hypothetical protein